MVIGTGTAVMTVVSGGAFAVVAAGAGSAAGTAAVAKGTTLAVGIAIGTSTAAGGIDGAIQTKTLTGSVVGAIAGGGAAAGIGGCGLGLGFIMTGTTVAAGIGPWGLLGIGTRADSEESRITYDCWKPVVHDMSVEPSDGMLLKDLICHPNITEVTMSPGNCHELPSIVLRNTWEETFEIEYLWLHDTGKITGHAKPICL